MLARRRALHTLGKEFKFANARRRVGQSQNKSTYLKDIRDRRLAFVCT
jgi:hypothetical protein